MEERLGKYRLVERISQGGMAEVFLAKAFGLEGADSLVAIKRIRADVARDPAFIEMFIHEAKLSAMLNHASIGRTFELGKTDDSYYIAMEYVPGFNLRSMLDRARHQGLEIPLHLVMAIVVQVLEALDFAHRFAVPGGKALGIVHRDVSPHNVLVSFSGEVKLIDFGIAKATNEQRRHKSNVLKGKYGYMSPEQVMGKPLDGRSDVFSAGVLAWELLTGRRLFEGASDFSILEKVRFAEVYPPSLAKATVPEAVEPVVLKALRANRENRYDSASDMRDGLVEVMLRSGVQSTPRELANLMTALFGPELAEHAELMSRARQLSENDDEPDLDTHPEYILPKSEGTGDTRPDYIVSRPLPDTNPMISLVPDTQPMAPKKSDTQPDHLLAADTQPEIAPGDLTADGFDTPPGFEPTAQIEFRTVEQTEVRAVYRRRTNWRWLVGAGMFALGLVLLTWWWVNRPRNGEALITSHPPNARVLVDEHEYGNTPLRVVNLTPGKHVLRLELEGFDSMRRVFVVTGGEVPINLELNKKRPSR